MKIQLIFLIVLLSLLFTISGIYFLYSEGRLCFLLTSIMGVILVKEFGQILYKEITSNKVK